MIGRPTKYSTTILEQLEDYMVNYEVYGDIVPSAAGFACAIQVSKTTLYTWAEKHKPFLYTLGRLNAAQERIAMGKGLDNTWNATIVKLLLANHGYHDRVDQNVEVKKYRVIPAEDVEDADNN